METTEYRYRTFEKAKIQRSIKCMQIDTVRKVYLR